MAALTPQTTRQGLTCADVVERHSRLGPLYRQFPRAVSPYDLINLYLVGHGLRMDPAHKFIVRLLNQDKRTILLHLLGTDYCGEFTQTIDGYQHNDDSEFLYDPYDNLIYFDGHPITDLVVRLVRRSPVFRQYYIRNLSIWDGPILVTDENDGYCPGGCTFCPKAELQRRAVISTPAFLDTIMQQERLTSLDMFSEIAVVTSLFKNEQRGVDYITTFMREARQRGFCGIINYMTCQFTEPTSMDRIAETCKETELSFLHLNTVEQYFDRRQTMGVMKGSKNLPELTKIIREAVRHFGSLRTGYNYVLGTEPFERFREGLSYLYDTGAVPHVNIFTPFPKNYNTKLTKVRRDICDFNPTPEYVAHRIEFIVKCRAVYLDLYDRHERIYTQNNCGKLFPYPGDPQHFYGHHVQLGTVDLAALREFDEWENSVELDRPTFEREKIARYEALQSRMLKNYDEVTIGLLERQEVQNGWTIR